MANINSTCPICGERVCNGVGPSGMPTVTTILNLTPSGSLFFNDACQHDIDYHLQIGRALADTNFLHNMLDRVERDYPEHKGRWFDWINPLNGVNFTQRKYFTWRANRMYWYVAKFGKEAYKAGACIAIRKKANEGINHV